MFRSFASPRLAGLGIAAVVLSACSATAGQASPSAPATPTLAPSAPTSPTATPEPTAPAPTKPASPEAPTPSPTPTESPIAVVRINTGVHARVATDGVPVRQRPGLDQPIVAGYDTAGADVPEVRLDAGQTVGVIWGPVLADGVTWYSVVPGDTGTLTFSEGWIAADDIVEEDLEVSNPAVLTSDGLGSGAAASGEVPASAALYVNVMAVPMPGDASCEAEVTLIGTDGEHVAIGASEVTEPTQFFSSPLENNALLQDDAGSVTLQVRSDCSWAGMAFIPAG